jgi:hypothetical protein
MPAGCGNTGPENLVGTQDSKRMGLYRVIDVPVDGV